MPGPVTRCEAMAAAWRILGTSSDDTPEGRGRALPDLREVLGRWIRLLAWAKDTTKAKCYSLEGLKAGLAAETRRLTSVRAACSRNRLVLAALNSAAERLLQDIPSSRSSYETLFPALDASTVRPCQYCLEHKDKAPSCPQVEAFPPVTQEAALRCFEDYLGNQEDLLSDEDLHEAIGRAILSAEWWKDQGYMVEVDYHVLLEQKEHVLYHLSKIHETFYDLQLLIRRKKAFIFSQASKMDSKTSNIEAAKNLRNLGIQRP